MWYPLRISSMDSRGPNNSSWGVIWWRMARIHRDWSCYVSVRWIIARKLWEAADQGLTTPCTDTKRRIMNIEVPCNRNGQEFLPLPRSIEQKMAPEKINFYNWIHIPSIHQFITSSSDLGWEIYIFILHNILYSHIHCYSLWIWPIYATVYRSERLPSMH